MKYLLLAFLSLACLQTGFGQKYTNTNGAEVTTEYKEATFSSKKSLTENLENVQSFSFFMQVLAQPSVTDLLSNEEMVTVFVPTNAAFASFSEEEKEALLKDTQKLQELVKQHTIPGRVDAYSITYQMEKTGGAVQLKTLSNETLNVRQDGDNLIISTKDKGSARVLDTDFYHKNGFFHIVDGTLFPSDSDK
ncbi:fasciclin domain-containing protein [Luteirhabdus pelagi]|uniref:fasciclin domain-containing protein n=1 Tax=Luteirhabdus pelagi TaxID=2792783 RepID=UPI00193A9041|nr:fasciclin domain-containing protein [Luteirhabdus pelagi]